MPLVGRVHAGVLEALAYGRSITPDHLLAMTVVQDEAGAERIEKEWAAHDLSVPLEIVVTASDDFTDAALSYVEELKRRDEGAILTVLIPEMFVEHWWQHLLHNQTTLILKGRLLFRKRVVVTSLPYRIE